MVQSKLLMQTTETATRLCWCVVNSSLFYCRVRRFIKSSFLNAFVSTRVKVKVTNEQSSKNLPSTRLKCYISIKEEKQWDLAFHTRPCTEGKLPNCFNHLLHTPITASQQERRHSVGIAPTSQLIHQTLGRSNTTPCPSLFPPPHYRWQTPFMHPVTAVSHRSSFTHLLFPARFSVFGVSAWINKTIFSFWLNCHIKSKPLVIIVIIIIMATLCKWTEQLSRSQLLHYKT